MTTKNKTMLQISKGIWAEEPSLLKEITVQFFQELYQYVGQ